MSIDSPERADVTSATSGRHRSAKPGKTPKAAKAPKPAKAPSRPSRWRPLLVPVVGVLTLAAFVVAAVLQFSGGPAKQLAPLNSETKAALTAANRAVKDVLSYDYRQLDSNINTAKSEITGQLLTDYTSSAKKVIVQAVPIKALVSATVSAQSVVQAQSGRVTVLLYVDQESVKQLAGSKTPTTRIDPLRIRMTMTKVKGHWLASELDSV
jgi:Mce-associated membrane protein